MQFSVINCGSGVLNGVVPPDIAKLVEMNNVVAFAAIEGKDVVGICLFMIHCKDCTYGTMEYIHISEEYAGGGLADELLDHAEKLLAKYGVQRIFVKKVGDIKGLGNIYDFLVKNSYVPVELNGRFVVYYLDDLTSTIFVEKIPKLEPLMNNVKYLNEIPEKTIRRFEEEMKRQKRNIELDKLDLFFSAFYVKDNEIIGFMNLKEVAENVIFFSDLYLSKKDTTGLIFPAMIAKTLKLSCYFMPPETLLVMQIDDENGYKGIKTIFGEAEEDDLITEYFKDI